MSIVLYSGHLASLFSRCPTNYRPGNRRY